METSSSHESTSVSDFVSSVDNFLKQGQVENALSVFDSNKNEDIVKNNSWDIIPVITKYLTREIKENKPKEFMCCQKLITLIGDKSNPEETLLQLLEEIEETEDDVKFINILTPLQCVLKRISLKKINSFAWSFNAIQTFLQKLPTPTDLNLIEEEKVLMDCDSDFQRITTIYFEIIPFYECFVDESFGMKGSKTEMQKLLCKFLIQLFGKPLSHLHVDDLGKVVGRAKRIGEKLIDFIFRLNRDPYIYLEQEEICSKYEFEKPSIFSLAVFYYFISQNENCRGLVPKLYDSVYIFQHSLKFVTALLVQEEQSCIEKALSLISSTLNDVRESDLSYLLLDSKDHSSFCKSLSSVITFNSDENIRKQALQIWKMYLYSFELRGQYLIIYNMMNILNHTGLIGYIISTYKELLANEITKNETNMPIYFVGEKLWVILSQFCYLPKKEESDLLELSDQIIASLNLLRYLIIRDKGNVTGIKSYLPQLQHEYLEPLKKAIMLSRAHYELKIRDINEESKSVKEIKEDTKITVTICGQNLPEMPSEEKKKVLRSSLTAFDVMDSLLCRLNEYIEAIE